ncbi:AI-2E family transporter [Falsirhodobacter sp. alg1]|uniref:AI-2E family transporter n=1 Tax=Falsirhodobacter sp. alg1 TaxID=1472418 RepID=UPI000788483D|nr:AI-2E family transporter [Falsirhodobacter sp. alg1]
MDRLDRLARYAVIFMGVFALFAALRIGEGIFAPLVLAMVAGVVLSPISDLVARWGMRPVVGALLSLLLTLTIVGGLAAAAQPLVMRLFDKAPQIWSELQTTVDILHRFISGFSQMSDGLRDALSPPAAGAQGTAEPAEGGLESAMPTMADALLFAPSFAGQILIFIGALFFFLLTRADVYGWASRLAEPSERADLARRLHLAETLVARYFLTITVINLIEGLTVAGVLHLIGMPGAMLWGLAAFLLNYILYIGPAMMTVSLLFGGIAVFDGWQALLPVIAYILINGAEGQFITPTLIGRHTAVNPLLVFLSLVFGMWLWGPIGGIVAIPLLLWVLQINNSTRTAKLPANEP